MKKRKDVLITLKDVWKTYQMGEVSVHALRGVNIDIMSKDFTAIIGASGSGKSTMMNLIGCLDKPTKGTIEFKGKDVGKLNSSELASFRGQTVGFIFQQYNLIQSLSAYDNVKLPLEMQEYNENESDKATRKVLDLVGLTEKMHHLPTQLSGGQQQRVSIARSLVGDPDIILADEPTGALDSKTGTDVIKTLHKLWENGKTVIMITHDINLAKYSSRYIELKDGQIINEGGKLK